MDRPLTIDELKAAGFKKHGIYAQRHTAESMADWLRDQGFDTAIREDHMGEQHLYRRARPVKTS